MKVRVTERHIEGANNSSEPASCPLALAINDVLVQGYHAHVGRARYSLHPGEQCSDGELSQCVNGTLRSPDRHEGLLSYPAQEFVVWYDRGLPMGPRTIGLDIPKGVRA